MASATWTCNKDARIASNGTNLGAGTSDFNPFGKYGSYQYRVLLGFPGSMAGWTSITGATLHYRTSTQYYVAFGSSPTALFSRITGAWSEGSSSGMSASNAVVYPGPATTATNRVSNNMPTSQSSWATTDITAMMRDVLAGGAFQGIQIIGWNGSGESSSAADVGEIYSREGGSAPYITFSYETNVAPTAPTQTAPANGATGITGTNPTLAFSHNDADGDALLNYDLQISTDSTFASVTHKNVSAGTAGISGSGVSVAYNSLAGGAGASRGVTYYWRVATRSATGILTVSPWSATFSFKLNQLPTVAITVPSAANANVQMVKVAGNATNPRMVVTWTFGDPDGGAQAKYRVLVQNDSSGSPGSTFYDTTTLSGTIKTLTIPLDPVRGNFYHVSVTVTDAAGETAVAGPVRCHVQWAVMEYRIDLGGTVTAWSTVATSTAPTNTAVVTEYASSAAGGAIGTWFSALSGAALARWFHYRVWLFAWSGAGSPSFTKMAVTYTSAVGVPPDGWTVTAQHSLDTSQSVYGTQSLKVTCNGTTLFASQLVSIRKNTDYILSGRIRADGNPTASLTLASAAQFGGIVGTAAVVAQQDWTRMVSPVWNSGDNEQIYVQFRASGAAGSFAWFDALKLEASTVVTSWNPGMVGEGVTLDAGGIMVDASPAGGATLRLQAGAGGARDIVELGANGFMFGGDANLWSPASKRLQTDSLIDTPRGSILPISMGADLRNLVGNPGFEVADPSNGTFGCRGWSATNAALRSDASAVFTHTGQRSASVSAMATQSYLTSSQFPVDGSTEYVGTGWVCGYGSNPANTANSALYLRWYDYNGVQIGGDANLSGSVVSGNQQSWQRYNPFFSTVVSPKNAVMAMLFVTFPAQTAGDIILIDDMGVYRADVFYSPSMFGDWMVDNMLVNTANTQMGYLIPSQTVAEKANPLFGRAGRITGIAWRLSSALTAGSLVIRTVVGGTTLDVVTITSASGLTGNPAIAKAAFVGNNGSGLQYRTDASFAPTGSLRLTAQMIVEYVSLY